MIGGKVVGTSESVQLSPAALDGAVIPDKRMDVWHPCPTQRPFEISGSAMIQDAGDVVRTILKDGTVDVTIQQAIGNLPRKMKKARRATYHRNTKWKRKLADYIHRRSFHIPRAEMVVTPDQFDTLRATIHGSTIVPRCTISGKQMLQTLDKYKSVKPRYKN